MYWMYWGEGWREEEWPGNVSLFHGLSITSCCCWLDCSCCPTVLLEGNSWAINSFGLYIETLKLGTISAFEKWESFSHWLWFWRPARYWWMCESGWGEVLSIYQPIWKYISSASTVAITRRSKIKWKSVLSEGILRVSALQTSSNPFGSLVRRGNWCSFSSSA